jgi:hypothetical protein
MGTVAVSYPGGTEGNEAFEGSMGFTFEGKQIACCGCKCLPCVSLLLIFFLALFLRM